MSLHPFPSQTIGPFYHFALTTNASLGCLAGPMAKGERIRLRLRLLDGDGKPVSDGMLELWQADANGIYRHPDDPRHAGHDPHFSGFGRLATSADGECLFETVRPGKIGSDAAAHINVTVFSRGLLGRLNTRVYFAEDPDLAKDSVLMLVPADRRRTLIAVRDAERLDQWNLDVHMQGDEETVFFDFGSELGGGPLPDGRGSEGVSGGSGGALPDGRGSEGVSGGSGGALPDGRGSEGGRRT